MLAQGAYGVGAPVELGKRDTCLPLLTGDDLLSVLFFYSSLLDKVLTKCLMYAVGRRLSQYWERWYWWMLAPTFRMELGPPISWAAEETQPEAMDSLPEQP